jgi:hypothetical protein
MTFTDSLSDNFPGALLAPAYIAASYKSLQGLGFNNQNTIACAGLCRDEITRALVDEIQAVWGEAFNFSSLAGLLFLGKTGFLAAQAHSPQIDGREHYVFYGLTHIAIDADGQLGFAYRTGRDEPSYACGALAAFQAQLSAGQLDLAVDPLDMEMSLLKQRLFRLLPYGQVPDLLALTRLAYHAIVEDLDSMLALTVNPEAADYAVLTGIQVHAPAGDTYVWPGEQYTVRSGLREPLKYQE